MEGEALLEGAVMEDCPRRSWGRLAVGRGIRPMDDRKSARRDNHLRRSTRRHDDHRAFRCRTASNKAIPAATDIALLRVDRTDLLPAYEQFCKAVSIRRRLNATTAS